MLHIAENLQFFVLPTVNADKKKLWGMRSGDIGGQVFGPLLFSVMAYWITFAFFWLEEDKFESFWEDGMLSH